MQADIEEARNRTHEARVVYEVRRGEWGLRLGGKRVGIILLLVLLVRDEVKSPGCGDAGGCIRQDG